MIDSGSRRGAANLAPVLMILSFVAMVAFLFWLGVTSEGTEGTIAMQEDTAEVDEGEGTVEVTPDELGGNTAAYEGQRIRVSADMAGQVGSQAFFLDLPQSPFLVAMNSALVEERGGEMPSGEVTVTGMLLAMSDSVVGAWQDAGRIAEEDVPVVEFATHFMEASSISPADGGEGENQGEQDDTND